MTLPALTGLVVAVAPRRAVQPAAIAGLVLSGGAAISLALVALAHPAELEVTGWVVVDAAPPQHEVASVVRAAVRARLGV